MPLLNLRADPASLSVVCHMSLSTLGFRVESDIYITRLDSCDTILVCRKKDPRPILELLKGLFAAENISITELRYLG